MSSSESKLLVRYRYDALDCLLDCAPIDQPFPMKPLYRYRNRSQDERAEYVD